jgi:uncharacterized protein YkwD
MSSPAILAVPVEARRRLVVLLVALTLAVTALVGPMGTPAADATTAPRLSVATTASFARSMLALLNGERAAHHLRPLYMNSKLILSAHRHNLTMASRHVMSHQLPGEAFFATRITRAGYRWQWAGENIGYTSDLSVPALLVLQRKMYNERPPQDTGHRLNILSTRARQVGIDVYYDAKHHTIWFTQDFGQPR